MWIRSQNKTILVNCNEFHINNIGDNKEIHSKIGTDSYFLGKYETEERAVDVLDCIQYRIVKGYKEDVIKDGIRTAGECIYQMPRE